MEKFANYKLRRTTPKLAGNMQLDLIIGRIGSKGYVRQAHISPMSSLISFVPSVDEIITTRPHQLNIKKFYEQIKDNFYSSIIRPELASDWPYMVSKAEQEDHLKYLKNWDDTYWGGCKRMSYQLYGTTHSCLVPVWLENVENLRFDIVFYAVVDGDEVDYMTIPIDLSSKSGAVEFHDNFVEYIKDYFKYTKLSEGNNNIISIDFNKNLSVVSGLRVESGNMDTFENLSIIRNLSYRERPLLEANSLITNTFMDSKMICPQFMNFNICFDMSDFVSQIESETPNHQVRIDVYVDGNKLETRDIYTNHEYVPRPRVTKTDEPAENALDYKHDYMCSDMIHQNKMTQPICHWGYVDKGDDLMFNLYDGFGVKVEGGYLHGFGNMQDTDIDKYDPEMDNINWAGEPIEGDGADIERILSHPTDYPDFFKDTSGYINGIEFKYEPPTESAPKKIFVGVMTTPWSSDPTSYKTAATSYVSQQYAIGILTDRVGPDGLSNLPKTKEDQKTEFDIMYDWHLYSDIDNRYAVTDKNGKHLYYKDNNYKWMSDNAVETGYSRVGGSGPYNTTFRELTNTTALIVCMRRYKTTEGDHLYVIFWHRRSMKNKKNKTLYANIYPDALTLGGVIKALHNYVEKYKPVVKAISAANISVPDLDDLEVVAGAFDAVNMPDVVMFNNTIIERQDNALTQTAKEITYYKLPNISTWVWRYSGKLRPAIFEDKVMRINDLTVRHDEGFGMNYAYEKLMILDPSMFNPDFRAYINSNIPPKYPSVGYDSVLKINRPGIDGDIMYNEPHPWYLGKELNGQDRSDQPIYKEQLDTYSTYTWPEYKWFDRSVVRNLSKSMTYDVTVSDNSKQALEDKAKEVIQIGVDFPYIKQYYKLEYDLQRVEEQGTLLRYKIKATLK